MSWKVWNMPMERGPVSPIRDPNAHLLYFAAVAVGDKVYYFGCHYDGTSYVMDQIDASVFNTVTLRWMKFPPVTTRRGGRRPVKVPSKRFGHTAVLIESIVYIWGGVVTCKRRKNATADYVSIEGDYLDNTLYAFDVDTHTWLNANISGLVPLTRAGHSACVLGKVMYVYGGYNKLTGLTNDMYKLDTTTMVWSSINTRGTPPPVTECHSATIIGTKMFVFGGMGHQGVLYNNISVFDTDTSCWLNTIHAQFIPEGRYSHAAFTYKGELYIFGGYDHSSRKCNDLWKLNPQTFSWQKVEPIGKGQDWNSDMWCCMSGNRIILFGGYTTNARPILQMLDLSPTLKMLCKLAVIQYSLEQAGLPHNIRWELVAMTT